MGLLRGIVTRAAGRGAAGRRPAGGVGGVGGAARPKPGAGAGSRAQDEAIGRGVRGLLRRLR